MKVGLIVPKIVFSDQISNTTGIGRYVTEFEKRLRYYVDVVKFCYNYSSLSEAFISSITFNFKNYKDFDLIHLLEPKFLIPLRKKKFVVTVYDLFFLKYKEGVLAYLYSKLKNMYTLTISYADAVIVISSLTGKEVRQLNKNVYIVNPGIDEKFFYIPKVVKENRTFKFGYVGRIDAERKNVLRGIQVFKKFNEDAVFELWGPYNKESDITKRILKEIDQRVRLMGPFQESEIIKIYDSFDALLFPSIEEGFGFPILEAQARGIPVIVFNDAKIPDEVCKYCIKIKDELPSISEIKEFKEKYMKEMIEYAKTFTWEKTVKETLKIYRELLER